MKTISPNIFTPPLYDRRELPEQIQRAIANLEENIEIVAVSNFCDKEKADLKAIYRMQIRKYKEKQVSFYSDSLTPKFVE